MSKEVQNQERKDGELDKAIVTPVVPSQVALFSRKPKKAMEEMRELVQIMSNQCTGAEFIADINGKCYPKVEWWTTLGATLGLFPVVVYSRSLNRDDETAYEARVEVHHSGRVVAAGEALCSSREPNWSNAPEFSIKSMAITRATGKAYRIPLSFIAVMAGLAPTNAEEMMHLKDERVETGNSNPATPKQISYISLICDKKYGNEYPERIRQHLILQYGVGTLDELTKNEASGLIEFLLDKNELLTADDE